jgi:hypothetical protein
MFCTICKQEKSKNEMSIRDKNAKTDGTKYKNYCKKCASEITKKWRSKKTPEELKGLNKRHYRKNKKRIQEDENYAIRCWVHSCKSRGNTSGFESRKDLCTEHLIELCHEALKKFPYLVFKQGKEKWQTPSLDRIDSNLPYSNDNVRIIPLWLNSALLDMSDSKLHELMVDYLKDHDIH